MLSQEERKKDVEFFEKWAKRFEEKKGQAMESLSRFPDSQKSIGESYDNILFFVKLIIEAKQQLLEAENEIRRLKKKSSTSIKQKKQS